MKRPIHNVSARQDPGEPSRFPGRAGDRNNRAREPDMAVEGLPGSG